ncbi:1-phosphatidylinositol-4,5-bisphosphate phosphodiesterase 1 [Roridomyces roridus]|uniref:Phosphoinositide phospholipase C n=1 Tax=Roridomyces roridus TaxID=1738132 RepID=A0AAD7BKE0_9AGAR|nr:1-phosphatidylinositol-4,5-bisphosphate phosphodiesterase 1 [Roridomyces roridus]
MTTPDLTVVPQMFQEGVEMLKVKELKTEKMIFRIDPDEGQIIYPTRTVAIETIREIRTGSEAEYHCAQLGYSGDFVEKWITIVHLLSNAEHKLLHILAPTREMRILWESTLRKFRLELLHSADNADLRETVWARRYWKGANKGGDQTLTLDEVQSMCKRLAVNLSPAELEKMFNEADTTHRKSLDFEDFKRFVKLLKRRPELEALYKKFCNEAFDFSAFEKFMKQPQKSTLNSEQLKALFDKYAASRAAPANPSQALAPAVSPPSAVPAVPAPSTVQVPPPSAATTPATVPPPSTAPSTAPSTLSPPSPARVMSLEDFSSFLVSQDNAPTHPESNDMTMPLSSYFISTSHNTYLVGNQLVGVSTVEGYVRALLSGCRSVELDIYDGPHEPRVFHGSTLTSAVSVRDVCDAISKYAFISSPYPIILSCEVHCGLAQQDMLVDIFSKAFGSALVSAPVEQHPKITMLPSPEALKGRILIKTKNLYIAAELAKAKKAAAGTQPAHLEADLPSSSESSDGESEAKVVMSEIKEEMHELKTKWQELRSKGKATLTGSKSEPKRKAPMSMALASLLVYTVGVKCRGINKNEQYAPEDVFSLSEKSATRMIKEASGMENLIRHNLTNLVRIYPKGIRIDSTNYEPHQYWAVGCQLVALNIQTMDLGYRINQAMFMRNGHQGYVLKPFALRDPQLQQIQKHSQHFLDVVVISAQQLPRPKDNSGKEILDKFIVDPYIEVELHIPVWPHPPFLPQDKKYNHSPPSEATSRSGTSARTISCATGPVMNNGFNPMWQEEISLPFDCVGGLKELIFVEFSVKQHKKPDEEPLARYIAPLLSLEPGFRHLPLHDRSLSQYLFSTLFVKIDVRDV